MLSTVPAIDQRQWAAYKHEIGHLFLEKEKSHAEIIAILAAHEFFVTKSQLGVQLKKWNFRRRISRKNWEAIEHRIEKRKAAKKESAVWISGVRASPRKVHRETSRFKALIRGATSPKLDPDAPVDIRTPPAQFISSFLWPLELPFILFQSRLNTLPDVVLPVFEGSEDWTNSPMKSFVVPQGGSVNAAIKARIREWRNFIPTIDEVGPGGCDGALADKSTGLNFRDLVKTLIFQLSNNLHGSIHACELFLVLAKHVGLGNLPILDAAQGLSELCFVEKILQTTITQYFRAQGSMHWWERDDSDRAMYLGILDWVFECGCGPDTRILAEFVDDKRWYTTGGTPLQIAIISGAADVVELLLNRGADVNSIYSGKAYEDLHIGVIEKSPLELALNSLSCCSHAECPGHCGSASIIRLLLDREAGRDAGKRDHQLLAAIRAGNLKIAQRLLDYGADLHCKLSLPIRYDDHLLCRPGAKPYRSLLVDCRTAFTAATEFKVHEGPRITTVAVSHSSEDSSTATCQLGTSDCHETDSETTSLKILHTIIEWMQTQSQEAFVPAQDWRLVDVAVIAAERNFTRLLSWLIEIGVDILSTNSRGVSPFFAAIKNGSLASCQLLLDHGALREKYGKFALHVAVVCRQHKVLEKLISAQADIHLQARTQELEEKLENLGVHSLPRTFFEPFGPFATALQIAMRCGEGVGVNSTSAAQSSAILLRAGAHLAGGEVALGAVAGDADLVHLALAAGASPNERRQTGSEPYWFGNWTCLQIACSRHDTSIVTTLLHAGADWQGDELFLVIDDNHGEVRGDSTTKTVELLSILEEYGADPQKRLPNGATCLERAFSNGSIPLIWWATHRLPRVYDSGLVCAMMQHISRTGCSHTLQSLQDLLSLRTSYQAADIFEGTALAFATISPAPCSTIGLLLLHLPPSSECYYWDKDFWNHGSEDQRSTIKKFHFWRGSDIHWFDPICGSPLAIAALAATRDPAWLLLSHGLRPDPLALLCAVQQRSLELADRFLTEGIQRLGQKDTLPSPLWLAVRKGGMDMARLLIRHGFDPDDRPDIEFSTPLQEAVKLEKWEIASYLLDVGADVNAKPRSRQGATTLQYAAIHGNIAFARMLLDRDKPAKINAHRSVDGRTALEGAAEHGRLDMIQLLLSCGAKISGSGQRQYIRAIWHAEHDNHLVVSKLLRSQREWTCEDKFRWDKDEYDVEGEKTTETTASECSDSDCSEEHDASFWEMNTSYYCSSCRQNHTIGETHPFSALTDSHEQGFTEIEDRDATLDIFTGSAFSLEVDWNQYLTSDHDHVIM
ncbi:ankyrin repeat-containing domain protein [Stachybotrys elegans]|uniref:Ankyrin repeat-containing domain protein n=1 Tax=Stachybotrys elegans TaxID=80388 RepID=A0A8K0STS9_9HYPO|nr:ankyrin repeat-containing domain protein [Stachybotrys elegans]